MTQEEIIEIQRSIWKDPNDWVNEGHSWSEFFGGTQELWTKTIFPKIEKYLKGDVLEIAPGHGRMTAFLIEKSNSLEIVDFIEECIEKCREKFGDRIKYHINNGKSLDMIENNSKDFVFSWDAFVHIDKDTINDYLMGIYNVLKPGGYAFIHHSNFMGGNEDSSQNKGGRSNMTAELFASLAKQNDLEVISQERVQTSKKGPKVSYPGCKDQEVYDTFDYISLSKKPNPSLEDDGKKSQSPTIIFKEIEQDFIKFTSGERVEDVTVRVDGLYSPSDDSAHTLYSSYFELIDPSVIYFTSYHDFLGYPFLKLVFEKKEEEISEILIPVDNQWSLSNYFSNSELKEINKGDMGSYKEIFLSGDYGSADEIPNVNTIVDLGFNCGWFALFSADKAQKYIAIEADDRIKSIGLTVNKKNRDKIQICNRVFHDTNDKDITFHLSPIRESATNSIWNKLNDNKDREPVPKKTINLPEIMKRYNLDYIDFLKVDIEGAEKFLLEKPNFEIVLNKVGVLCLEVHGDENIKAFNENLEIKSYFDRDLLGGARDNHGHQQIVKLTKKPELKILQCINTKQN